MEYKVPIKRGSDGKKEFAAEMKRLSDEGWQFFGRYRLKFAGAKNVVDEGSKPWPNAKAPSWLAKVPASERKRVQKILDDERLGHRAADILSLARPAIHFTLATAKAPSAVTTRFGGAPDLPDGFAWPMNGATPLAFVAQLDLRSLAPLDLERRLPRTGLLTVFAHLDLSDDYAEHGRVFHFADTKALVRTQPPHSADQDGRPAKTALAKPSIILTLPPLHEKSYNALRLTNDEETIYDEGVLPRVRNARKTPSKPGAHQVLGWSDGERPSTSFELLAQIDSDGRFGFEIGDVETLRIWVPTKKLAAKSFTSAAFTLMQ